MNGNTISTFRQTMTQFWQGQKPTLESIILDTNAAALHEDDTKEILSYLPDLTGKTVLELGAGIGRFTSHFAKVASHVTAVDFNAEFLQKNRATNQERSNVSYVMADVTTLELPENKYDLVFSNWLFMYLDNSEIAKLSSKILSWLKEGGTFFVREACIESAGNLTPVINNPIVYRHPTWYSTILTQLEDNERQYRFSLGRFNSVITYIKLMNCPYQIYFLFQKERIRKIGTEEQAFLDQNQYSRNGILRYERIFGRHFVSTGGPSTTDEFCRLLNLKEGQTVLDVGCGTGGSAFHISKNYGACVHGVDLSSNMLSIARERMAEIPETQSKVWFELCDVTKQNYLTDTYDVVYSRDALLHIVDKDSLFRKILQWLKPGGRILISDYCMGDRENYSQEFLDYVAQRNYRLTTVPKYKQILENVGFEEVKAENLTQKFIEILHTEMTRFEAEKQEFLRDFSLEDYNDIMEGWKKKVVRCSSGDQGWGLFFARKPLRTFL